jgi:hypothetical protein
LFSLADRILRFALSLTVVRIICRKAAAGDGELRELLPDFASQAAGPLARVAASGPRRSFALSASKPPGSGACAGAPWITAARIFRRACDPHERDQRASA